MSPSPLSTQALSEALRQEARRLGADLVGFAPAALPQGPGGPKAYQDWISQGMHGEMGYMARSPEHRSDIRAWFPQARSVVLCAFSYHDGTSPPRPDSSQGRLARYSLPPDYHGEIRARLKQLLSWYQETVSGGLGKTFVDTSPVLERLYSRYAGMGWVGKNTMLISQKIGSFFFLAGMAVDRELLYDEPVPEHCGTCNRCLTACPTQAFPQPHVLDATKCIAYFTVEHRDKPIPEEHRPGVGDWIFGCDICQDVCPWNRFAIKSSVFEPQWDSNLPLEDLASLTPEEFESRFCNAPMHRTGYRNMLRNVLLAMGNSKEQRFGPTLKHFAQSSDSLIAEQARWSLQKLEFDTLK